MSPQVVSLKWDGHHSTLLSVFEKLLENSQLVDCTITTEGQKLKAHKEVLSAFSPYFEVLFRETNEINPTIILSGIKFNDMKSLIDFMYQGRSEVSEERIEDLIDLAECLQIKGLGGVHEEDVLAGTNNISIICGRLPLSSGSPQKQGREVEDTETASISSKIAAVNHTNSSFGRSPQHHNAADVPTEHLASQTSSVPNMVPNVDIQIPSELSLSLIPVQPTQSPIETDNILLHGESLAKTNTYLDIVENVIELKDVEDGEIIVYESNGNSIETPGEETVLGSPPIIDVTSDDDCEDVSTDCVPLEVLNSESCSRSWSVASESNELNSINLPLHLDSTVPAVHIEDPQFHSEFQVTTEQSGEVETLETECVDLKAEDDCPESTLQIIPFSVVSIRETVEKKEKCSNDCSGGMPDRTEEESVLPPPRLGAVFKRTWRRRIVKPAVKAKPTLPTETVVPQDSSSDSTACLSQKTSGCFRWRRDMPGSSRMDDGAPGHTERESINPPQRLAVALKRTWRRPRRKQVVETMPELPARAAELQVSPSNSSACLPRKRCGKNVTDPSEMKNNKRSMFTEKKCCCRVCGKNLACLRNLKLHMRTHTTERLFRCDKCKYAGVSLNLLEVHKRIHDNPKPYGCAYCDYKTEFREALVVHLRIHSGSKPYKCTQSNNASTHSTNLKVHQCIHTKVKPYEDCSECDSKSVESTPLQSNSGFKPYKCTECDYASAYSSDLKSHQSIHSELKPYECPECDYKTVKSCYLQRHRWTHSGFKPYKCTECDYASIYNSSLKRHQQTHHVLKS